MGLRGAKLVALCLLVAGIAAVPASAAETRSFSSSTPISTDLFLGTAGPMLPYPSAIAVADFPGTVTGTKVTLSLIGHDDIDEMEALLVGPGGQNALVLSDACTPGQNTRLNPLTFTFDDSAGSPVPESAPCTSGTFQPTNYGTTDTLDAPAPSPPAGGFPSALSAFNGTSPNGLWQLFVSDDAVTGSGTIAGGWTLELTTTGAPAPAPVATPVVKKKCKKHKKRSAAAAKKKRCKKKRR